jgi:nucleolar GTP-binding protein
MLAKLQGPELQRKRQEDDGDMDMDDREGEDGWEDDGMDVNGADTPNKKKAKRNDGAVAVVVAGGRPEDGSAVGGNA